MRTLATALCVCVMAVPALAQAPPGRFKELVTKGVTVFSPAEIRWTLHLENDAPLPETADDLAARLQRRYQREGYAKAAVTASFDEGAGTLRVEADEGRIDAVAFEGVDQQLAQELQDAFAVRPGDLYNTRQISRALETLLKPARGALRLGRGPRAEAGTVFHDSTELPKKSDAGPFDLVDSEGRRTLIVHVRRVSSDLGAQLGTEGREDWYSPVDGLNLALGFGGAIFDQRRFDHTYLQAYVSYKFARENVGYAVGLERSLFGGGEAPRLLVNADVHETTASDDYWRLSVTEQSLVSLAFKNTFRDYYDERGYQVGVAFQPNSINEARASWNAERHRGIANETEYSFFRDDEEFRTNPRATDGDLAGFRLGYTFDTRGLVAEAGRATLRRHTGPNLFGTFGGDDPGVRVDWTSEIARPALGGDFDFTRHIANARVYLPLSPGQRINARLVLGTSTGTLPMQRLFAMGGIGTVHGYDFKTAAGERMVLTNVEYHLGSYRRARIIGFLDSGRVYRPVDAFGPGSDKWLTGVGFGVGVGDLRVDFGWRADDIPDSFQVLVRFGPTF